MDAQQIHKVYLYRRIVLAKLYIDNNYPNKIDLDDIASEASFSKYHFIRLFKKAYGKTPHQYLTWVRLENSKSRLASGASVTETCSSVGFEEVSSFIHLFKRENLITPAAYQSQQLDRKLKMEKDPLRFIPGCFADQKGWK